MPATPSGPHFAFFELILSSHAKLSLIKLGLANGWKNHCLNQHHLQSRGRKEEASRERKNRRLLSSLFGSLSCRRLTFRQGGREEGQIMVIRILSGGS